MLAKLNIIYIVMKYFLNEFNELLVFEIFDETSRQ